MKLIGTQPYSFTYIFFMAAFDVQEESSIAETETIGPAKPRILVVWLFTQKVCQPVV